tara:strand:+ start:95 stop:271 length:177 start_codon:yes stop_codon:yes gene_type:complete
MNINENIWIESLETMGDAMDEVREAMADEQELTAADLDDWYTSLIITHENYEDHRDKS